MGRVARGIGAGPQTSWFTLQDWVAQQELRGPA